MPTAEVNGVDKYFSIIALFILFRETVEASIIVSVLLQFLSRSFPQLKKQGERAEEEVRASRLRMPAPTGTGRPRSPATHYADCQRAQTPGAGRRRGLCAATLALSQIMTLPRPAALRPTVLPMAIGGTE